MSTTDVSDDTAGDVQSRAAGIGRRGLLRFAGPALAAGAVGSMATRRAEAAPVSSPRFVTPATVAEVRANGSARPGSIYYVTDPGRQGLFALAPDSDAEDDGATVLVAKGGTRYVRNDDAGIIDVTWFGAVGDGIVDDTAAIRAAVVEAAARFDATSGRSRPTLYFPHSSGFRTTDTVDVPKGISIDMASEIAYDGPADRVALDVGTGGGSNGEVILRLNVIVRTSDANYAAWVSEDSIGVRLHNTQESVVHLERIMGFTIGAQCYANGSAGFCYNEVHLGYFVDNQIQLDLTTETKGWCNENLFFNGRLSCFNSTTQTKGKGRTGIRITSVDGSYTANNNNYFLKPSIELLAANAGEQDTIPILIEHGQYNHFESVRNESGATWLARVENESADNTINAGFGLAPVDDQSLCPTTEAHSNRGNLIDEPVTVFSSGSLVENACYYDGSTTVQIPGIGFMASNSTTVSDHGRVHLEDDCIVSDTNATHALTVTVDSSVSKQFVLKRDCQVGNYGRIYLLALGADGQPLQTPPRDEPGLIRTKRWQTIDPMVSLFGGAYRTPRDSIRNNGREDFLFIATEEVKAIRVILWHGSAALKIRSFSIQTIDEGAAAVSAGAGRIAGERTALAPPLAGVWPRGLLLTNAEPSVIDGDAGKYVVTGWQKVTAADSNELGTDWVELRSLTS